MNTWLVVIAASALGCAGSSSSSRQTEPTSKADCAGAANGMFVAAQVESGEKTENARASIVSLCTDSKWTAEATTCLRDTKTRQDLRDCRYRYLTGLQSDELDKTAGAVLSNTEALLAQFSVFKDKMCACKDADCAKRVSDELTEWSQKMEKETPDPPKFTEDQEKRASALGIGMSECMAKTMDSGADDPPPPP